MCLKIYDRISVGSIFSIKYNKLMLGHNISLSLELALNIAIISLDNFIYLIT